MPGRRSISASGAHPRKRPRRLIPSYLRSRIEGETASEHLFYALLGRLEILQEWRHDGEDIAVHLGDRLREVAAAYPGTVEEPTRLNVVLTDGELFVASRWGHTLYMAELTAPGVVTADGPVRGIAVASEPVTPAGWAEVPDRRMVVQGDRPVLTIDVS